MQVINHSHHIIYKYNVHKRIRVYHVWSLKSIYYIRIHGHILTNTILCHVCDTQTANEIGGLVCES